MTDSARNVARARGAVLVAVIVTAALYFIPYGALVAYPLLLLSTYAHEMGHGITAWIVGGSFQSFEMWPDGSGVASTAGNFSRIDQALISAGGLVGPAVLAGLLFPMTARRKLARWGLLLFGVALLVSCVVVVRGLFGWIFVGLVGAICVLIARRGSPLLAQGVVAFIATQLALAVFSRADYLFVEVAQTGAGTAPSDVAHMAEALLLPYWFWGGLCALFSVLVLIGGLWLFWRATRETEASGRARLEPPSP